MKQIPPAIGRARPIGVHFEISAATGTAGPPPPDDFWSNIGKILKLDRVAEILADLVEVFFRISTPVSR